MWAEETAGHLRAMLAHVRKLGQQPRLMAQRCRQLSAEAQAALTDVVKLYDSEGAGLVPPAPSSWSTSAASAQPTAAQSAPGPAQPAHPQTGQAETPVSSPAKKRKLAQHPSLPNFSDFSPVPKAGPAAKAPPSVQPPAAVEAMCILHPSRAGLLLDALSMPRPAGAKQQKVQVQAARRHLARTGPCPSSQPAEPQPVHSDPTEPQPPRLELTAPETPADNVQPVAAHTRARFACIKTDTKICAFI